MFEKTKKIIDKNLVENIKAQPCLVCKKRPSDCHHLSSRGAGNGEWIILNGQKVINCAPLCRKHHSEIHAIGRLTFIDKYDVMVKYCQEHLREDLLD